MNPDHRVFRITAEVFVALLGIALITMVARADWLGVAIYGVFFAVSMFFITRPRIIPPLFGLLFVSASLLDAAGYTWNLYQRSAFFDELAHFYTTFAVTLTLGSLVYSRGQTRLDENPFLFALASGTLAVTIGVAWELFEWGVRIIGNLEDTLKDFGMDLIGAFSAGVWLAVIARRRADPRMQSQSQKKAA